MVAGLLATLEWPLILPHCRLPHIISIPMPWGPFGCGANLNSWFQLQWPQAWEDVGIAAKELVPIVVAAALWGPAWNNSHIRFHSDNEAVVTVIQKRHAKHPVLTHLLHCLYFYSFVYHFHFSASHVPGSLNVIADAISRNHLAILQSLIFQATQEMIPTAVSTFLLSPPQWGLPNWTEQFVHSLPWASLLPQQVATGLVLTDTILSAYHTIYVHFHCRNVIYVDLWHSSFAKGCHTVLSDCIFAHYVTNR